MTQPEYIQVMKQIQTLRRSIETTSQNISYTPLFTPRTKYNEILWSETILCADTTIEQNFDVDVMDFVGKLLDNELNVVLECFVRLNDVIKTIQHSGKDKQQLKD